MGDANNIWTVVHDVGLATVGAWIGGRYALGVAKVQSRDQRAKEKADRRREMVKSIGVSLGGLMLDMKRSDMLVIDRIKEIAEAKKLGKALNGGVLERKSFTETLTKVNDLNVLAHIDGFGAVADKLLELMHARHRIGLLQVEALKNANDQAVVPSTVLDSLAREAEVMDKSINDIFISIRTVYNAE
jgi:hypothetical protein